MDFKPFVFGLVLVAGAIGLAILGPMYVQAAVATHEVGTLIPQHSFVVGDIQEFNRSLKKDVAVTVLVQATLATSNEPGEVDFYVFNEAAYVGWKNGQSAEAVLSKVKVSSINETFRVPESGTYYFVFDNRESLQKKRVSFECRFDRVVYVMKPDERVSYVAYGLLAFGAAVAAYGVLRKPPIPWQ